MGEEFHRGFTAAEKTELWDRWKRGESLKAIGRAFGKPSSSIYFLVAPHGGIRPAQRRRSRLALTRAEREVISRGITARQSARSMAKLLGCSPSTVSREMSRNGGCDRYRAALADESAWARARRPKCCKLANSPRLRQVVAGKLRLDWSPEQIAGWLKRTHPEDEYNQVSHETIHRSLFVQTRGVLKKELLSHLRSKRSMRRSKPVDPNGDRRGHIKDVVSIRQRPAAVEEVESKAGARKRPERGWCHFPFALEPLVFAGGGPAASLASRSAFRRSRLLEKAFCAISCSVIAFLASTWRNALRASRSALVICLGGRSPSGVFVISSPSAPARLPLAPAFLL